MFPSIPSDMDNVYKLCHIKDQMDSSERRPAARRMESKVTIFFSKLSRFAVEHFITPANNIDLFRERVRRGQIRGYSAMLLAISGLNCWTWLLGCGLYSVYSNILFAPTLETFLMMEDTLMDNMLCIVYDEKVGILKNCEYNLTRVNRPPPDPSS